MYSFHSLASIWLTVAYFLQMLKDTSLEEGFSIRLLAEQAEGLSGSDLKELCRNAAMRPMRELMREADGNDEKLGQIQNSVRSRLVRFDT